MSSMLRLAAFALLTVLAAALDLHAADNEDHTFSLFNGRDLAGWDVTNCEVAVEQDVVVLKAGNGLVRSNLEYDDFVLELDWRPRNTDAYDSGIFVRANFPSEKKGRPWPDRYQINLKRGEDGNLVGVKDAVSTGLAKPGEWNHFKITCVGPRIELEINGKPAWKHDGLKSRRGYLGIQAEVPTGGQFEFKNVRVTELGFRSLFNGKDLSGWQGATDGYAVEDGTLVALKHGSGNLFTADEFSDFAFRFDFKLEPGANNGLGIRAPMSGDIAYSGMELQILDDSAPEYRNIELYQHHGSVYGIVPAKPGHLKPTGDWNSQEVVCRGRQISVNLNGTKIVDANLDDATANGTIDGKDHPGVRRDRGHLALLGHGSRVEFRNLRIKPLTADAK